MFKALFKTFLEIEVLFNSCFCKYKKHQKVFSEKSYLFFKFSIFYVFLKKIRN